jgi:hypothetical protein
MKIVRLVAWVLCAAPLVAAADGPASAPGARADGTTRMPAARKPPISRPHVEPVSKDEWTQILDWMKIHCPNRYVFANRSGVAEPIKQLIAERYRLISRTQYKPLHDALLAQTEAQDKIFGDGIRLRKPGNSSERKAAEDSLRQDIHELFVANIDEKKARIERLTQEVNRQTKNEAKIETRWFNSTLAQVRGNRVNATTSAAPRDDATSEIK